MVRESVGYFAVLVSIPWAGGPVIRSLAAAASPRLARYHATDLRAFQKLLAKLLMFVIAIGTLVLIATVLFGEHLLRILFTSEYAAYANVLTWLVLYGVISYVVSFLGYGVTAARRFRSQMGLISVALCVTAVTSYILIPEFGLRGAAWALAAGVLAQGNCHRCGDAIDTLCLMHR